MTARPPRPDKVAKTRRILAGASLAAARHVRGLVDGTVASAFSEKLTNQDRAAMALANSFQAMERAHVQTETPRQLGVIVVHKRLEDTPQNCLAWEADAAKLNDRAIEAVAVPVERKPDGS